ncbi:MAG: RNA polymerase factor sigma-54 [Beijerinckiaceae bacterium]|nr:RNA polymerase factor sigma-54 [Beijerinckiaceae bacterium]MCZ8300438.1 RNA polymerase factor sigma-54 [Beijerinckiaceae bacterium]
MSISQKLMMRQSQSLVMTPQLLQAIKLLQFSTVELQDYVEAELEKNPLLERDARAEEAPINQEERPDSTAMTAEPGDWAREDLPADRATLERETGTDFENAFPDEAVPDQALPQPDSPFWNLSGGSGKGASLDDADHNLEAYCASATTLHQHLENQLGCTDTDDLTRVIAAQMIDQIDQTGYLLESLADISQRLGVPESRCQLALEIVQGFDPVGVGARNLAECLRIQLREKDRLDPAMAALVDHLDLLAKREFGQLRRVCGVDEEDLADMIAEIRRLDPKPGLIFGANPVDPVTPDVFVRATPDGGWQVDLNSDALPRVVANKTFYARVAGKGAEKEVRAFIDEAWTNANWIVRSLEQRARTILKVASEIVRQQDAFFTYGVAHLRPLNLKMIADAVSLHESTISRVTANKFMSTPRGLFEMKYFFTTAIASSDGGASVSSEAVRYRIKQLIDQEEAQSVLSDDAIVDKLRDMGIDIARRTVAKYREGLGIASSSVRRREKMAALPRSRVG